MPDDTQYDLSAAANDPDFIRADMKDKIAYLSAHDKDFAGAPIKDQMGYINSVLLKQGPSGREPSLYEKLTAGYDPSAANLPAPLRFLSAVGGGAMAAPGAILGIAKDIVTHPFSQSETEKGIQQSIDEWRNNPNVRRGALSVLPEALGGAVGNVAGGEAVNAIVPPVAKGIKKGTAVALRNEADQLRPITKVAGKLGGAYLGHLTGLPEAGVAGYLTGPEALESIVPRRFPRGETPAEIAKGAQKIRSAKAEMEEDFANKAEKAKTEQAKADKEVAKTQATSLSGQFPGATSSATPIGNAPLPEVPQGNPTPFPPVEGVTSTAPTRRAQMESAPTRETAAKAAKEREPSFMDVTSEVYRPGEEPDINNPTHMKILKTLLNRPRPDLEVMAKNNDRFAAAALRAIKENARPR